MIDGSLSLHDMKRLAMIRPEWGLLADRMLVASYAEFVTVLYRDIDQCVAKIEEDPHIRSKDGEDRLTAELIAMLCSRMYDASHDEKVGGHSDIVIRHPAGYLWVGEAKIHKDYAYLEKGFNQLTTRYLPGTPHADEGALIVYVRVADCAGVVSEWRERLSALVLPEYSDADCERRKELGFFSEHKHEGSGRKIRIRHIAVKQHHDPKDKRPAKKPLVRSAPKAKPAAKTKAAAASALPKRAAVRRKSPV
ncbi:hypothetical protein [Paraburkholderia sp. SUR17]|uniref:hypothetical protein n=1 Tax=Paraburkholderia sp. SUR17 TaxID=3034358 RepID=UPI002408170F|nr:hypothetical protein [Paraburkholderia sp. SUR17]WEY37752.1 hypothetical protein P2869_11760 [Paraburkholderia sp. SUR17]